MGNTRTPPVRVVGPLFRPRLQKVIQDEELAVIFPKEFWTQIFGDTLAESTAALCRRKRTLDIGGSWPEWERVFRGGWLSP